MKVSIDATRKHLSNVLDRNLVLYERYVSNPEMLAEYLEGTKDGLVELVKAVFDAKIEELRLGPEIGPRSGRSPSRPTLPLKNET